MNHQLTSKEGNDVFNDAHNTFYLRLYGVRHMVKDHSDSERVAHVVAAGFIFQYLSGPLPYVWSYLTINKMCWVCHLSVTCYKKTRLSTKLVFHIQQHFGIIFMIFLWQNEIVLQAEKKLFSRLWTDDMWVSYLSVTCYKKTRPTAFWYNI